MSQYWGKKTSYTNEELSRTKCIRCGELSSHVWGTCANGGYHIPLCENCDVSLNELILKWLVVSNWEELMEKYIRKVKNETLDTT